VRPNFYFSIKKTLNLFCKNHKISIQQNEEFLLAVNIDDLPLSKSSSSSFCPILCSVKLIQILIVLIFCEFGSKFREKHNVPRD